MELEMREGLWSCMVRCPYSFEWLFIPAENEEVFFC